MKFLLLLVVLVVAYAAWRSGRVRDAAQASAAQPRPPALPQDMVSCPVCALHLPSNEAVAGRSGRLYCSPEHRRTGGD